MFKKQKRNGKENNNYFSDQKAFYELRAAEGEEEEKMNKAARCVCASVLGKTMLKEKFSSRNISVGSFFASPLVEDFIVVVVDSAEVLSPCNNWEMGCAEHKCSYFI